MGFNARHLFFNTICNLIQNLKKIKRKSFKIEVKTTNKNIGKQN